MGANRGPSFAITSDPTGRRSSSSDSPPRTVDDLGIAPNEPTEIPDSPAGALPASTRRFTFLPIDPLTIPPLVIPTKAPAPTIRPPSVSLSIISPPSHPAPTVDDLGISPTEPTEISATPPRPVRSPLATADRPIASESPSLDTVTSVAPEVLSFPRVSPSSDGQGAGTTETAIDKGFVIGLSVAGFFWLLVIIGVVFWKKWCRGHWSIGSAMSYIIEAQSHQCEGPSDSNWDIPVDPIGGRLWSEGSGSFPVIPRAQSRGRVLTRNEHRRWPHANCYWDIMSKLLDTINPSIVVSLAVRKHAELSKKKSLVDATRHDHFSDGKTNERLLTKMTLSFSR
jgi:hypothetical protein